MKLALGPENTENSENNRKHRAWGEHGRVHGETKGAAAAERGKDRLQERTANTQSTKTTKAETETEHREDRESRKGEERKRKREGKEKGEEGTEDKEKGTLGPQTHPRHRKNNHLKGPRVLKPDFTFCSGKQ